MFDSRAKLTATEYDYLMEIEQRVEERKRGYSHKSQAQRLVKIISKIEKYSEARFYDEFERRLMIQKESQQNKSNLRNEIAKLNKSIAKERLISIAVISFAVINLAFCAWM